MSMQKICVLIFSLVILGATESLASNKLDVAVPVFDPGIPEDYDKWEKENIYPEVRRSEARYLALQLAETLTGTGQWGAVRVLPSRDEVISDIVVYATIVESTGGSLKLNVFAYDSTGKNLLKKKYKHEVHPRFYTDRTKKGVDPYQKVMAAIANDLSAKARKLKDKSVRNIKNTTTLRYGHSLAPEAFGDTLKIKGKKKQSWKIKHMPAENDPMLQRVAMVRLRDDMFTDAMQTTYQNFSGNMAEDYLKWRQESSIEYHAMKKAKKQATGRILGGILAAAAGVVVAAETKGTYGDAAAVGLIGAGAVGVASGVKKNKQASQYKAMMAEHAKSFDAAIEPQVVEFEEETATLTGTIEEQFVQFRELLARVYHSENAIS
ncbi:hypothetical protein [Kordiimonas sp.]|uniref:hypothetical protein n=1 Tax=Kordiimonas sp. TaxID=1970157 RepID=UPI003A90C7E8